MTFIRKLTTRKSICFAWSISMLMLGDTLFAQQSEIEINPLPNLKNTQSFPDAPANPFAGAFQAAYGNESEPKTTETQVETNGIVTSALPKFSTAIQSSRNSTQAEVIHQTSDLGVALDPGKSTIQVAQFENDFLPPNEGTPIEGMIESANFATPPVQNMLQPLNSPLVAKPFTNATFPDAQGLQQPLIWWRQQVQSPIYQRNRSQPVDTNRLVYDALKRSPRIRAISQDPMIRETQVIEADAEFDVSSFIRSQFQDRQDPVGDNLSTTIDGSQFLQDHIWTANAGVRKKSRTGASYELGQQIGFRNSNSSFFNPQDQGTATLSLNVTQPLLRGRGKFYNQSQILIAQTNGQVAWQSFAGELQDELQKTVDSYWQLYYSRSVFLQKQKNVLRGERVLKMLEGRQELDSLPSQIARARSAVQSRKTDLANAYRDIRDAETEIRRLTADRNWQVNQSIEMIPVEPPLDQNGVMELDQVVLTALKNRPEIDEAMKRAKIATIQRDVSVHELLPELSLIMGTYISALRGESQVFEAVGDQFGVKPGYSFGIEFEMPWRNRAARSRLTQRKLQVAKIAAEVDESMQNVVAESQVSLRRVSSAQETIRAAIEAIYAARFDLEQNTKRYESFALVEGDIADGQTPTTMLDQLLGSQERLTSAELVFSKAELDLKSAQIALQRTMGTLLMHQQVSFGRGMDCDSTPAIQLDQNIQR